MNDRVSFDVIGIDYADICEQARAELLRFAGVDLPFTVHAMGEMLDISMPDKPGGLIAKYTATIDAVFP